MNDDIRDLLRKLVPIIGEEAVRRAWKSLQLADAKTAKLIEFSLRRRLAEATGSIFDDEVLLSPIPPAVSGGSLSLGHVMYGTQRLHEFGLRPSELLQHLAIFGRTGSGKTNLCFLLLRQLARAGIPFLVFDWKQNYRDLIRSSRFENLVVHTVGRDGAPFFFNPLIPPKHVHPQEWLKKLIEIAGHAYFLGEGVAFVLQEVIDQLYRERGVYEGSGDWPTLRDVLVVLRARPVKGREAQWSESALRALGVLNFGSMDAVLNSGAQFPIERLLTQQAVLELDGLVHDDKVFLIESLLLWIHHHRMREPDRETLKHVLVVEEAHHILLRKQQQLLGNETVVDVIIREIRELGEGIIILDQLPAAVCRPALENTYTTIVLNLKEQGDVTAAAKAMLLDAKEAKHLGRLPVGWAVAKLQARWTKPFMLRFPLLLIRKGAVSDDEVHTRYVAKLDVGTAARLMKQSVDALVRLAEDAIPGVRPSSHATDGSVQTKLPNGPARLLPIERLFLEDVRDHAGSTVTDRYARLALSPRAGTEMVAELEHRHLVTSRTTPIDGAAVRLLVLSRTGRVALGLDPEVSDRLGGPVHAYWTEEIVKSLAAEGYGVLREAPIGNGQTVDLLVLPEGHRVAVEIETGNSDWRVNVDKCLDAGVDYVVIAAASEELRNKIQRLFGDESPRVKIIHATDVLVTLRNLL